MADWRYPKDWPDPYPPPEKNSVEERFTESWMFKRWIENPPKRPPDDGAE